jgi:hypothetical protein
MRPPKYPLQSLADVRGRQVDQATRELAQAVDDRGAAERKRLASEQRSDAHAAVAERVRGAEGEALARGELTAADLVRADAWEVRASIEREALLSEVDRKAAGEARAREVEDRARGQLAHHQAEAQVVSNDRGRWREALRKQVEDKEEEAAVEAWRPSKP